MQILNDAIREAFIKFRLACGSNSEAARRIGTSRGHYYKICNGEISHVKDDIWNKAKDHLEPFIRHSVDTSDPVLQEAIEMMDKKRQWIVKHLNDIPEDDLKEMIARMTELL